MGPRRLAIAALVFAGSAWTCVHYLGAWSLLLAAGWAAVAAVVIDALARRVSYRWTARALVALGIIAVALFAVAYPRLDTHEPGKGTDRDDDADVAVLAAAHGHYPFGARTYLGNPVTHLPGSLLVAAPFVTVGGSALENVVVVPLAVFVLARKTRSAEVLILVVGIAAASAGVWHEFLTGGNSLAEWTLLSAAAVWVVHDTRSWWRAALLGVALNVRANALSSAPAVWRTTRLAAIVVGVQLLLVMPFLLGGLHRFTPITGGSAKVAHLDVLFAHASTVLPALAALAGAGSAYAIARAPQLPPSAAALAALAASQLVQFSVLIVCSFVAGVPAWAENWTYYLALAVIPGAAAVAAA